MRTYPGFIGAVALAALIPAGQVGAETAGILPRFTCEDALNCLAYQVAGLEREAPTDPAGTATEMVFWSRPMAAKGSADEAAGFDSSSPRRWAMRAPSTTASPPVKPLPPMKLTMT